MDSLPTPEVYGIGAVAVVGFVILWRLVKQLFEVIKNNSEANERVANNLKENTQVTKELKDTIIKHNEFFQLLIASQMSKSKDERT